MTREYVDRVPTPEEHRRLAESVGWTHAFDWDAMPDSLAGSVCGVTVTQGGETIAMGRVVGDGVFYFPLSRKGRRGAPRAAGPGHRRRGPAPAGGAGRRARPAQGVHRAVRAAGESTGFYERHGFAAHRGMTGMFRVVPAGSTQA